MRRGGRASLLSTRLERRVEAETSEYSPRYRSSAAHASLAFPIADLERHELLAESASLGKCFPCTAPLDLRRKELRIANIA